MALTGLWGFSLAPEWLWGAQPYSNLQLHRSKIISFLSLLPKVSVRP